MSVHVDSSSAKSNRKRCKFSIFCIKVDGYGAQQTSSIDRQEGEIEAKVNRCWIYENGVLKRQLAMVNKSR